MQGSSARERDLTAALQEADGKLSAQLAAMSVLEARATAGEEMARGAASEAAQLRAKVAALDAALRNSQKEGARLKVRPPPPRYSSCF